MLIFRHADLDDQRHVEFARLFGELDDVKPYIAAGRKNRFQYDELFDVSNQEDDGSIIAVGSKRDHLSRVSYPDSGGRRCHDLGMLGNMKQACSHIVVGQRHFPRRFEFQPAACRLQSAARPRAATSRHRRQYRRASSFLIYHAYRHLETHISTFRPRLMQCGNEQFADTRTAYDELPAPLKQRLTEHNYVGAHSIWHSRKKAAPKDSPWLQNVDPRDFSFGRHRLVQKHEASGRWNLYVANHLHHLETESEDGSWVEIDGEEGTALIEDLLEFATQERYRISVEWKEPGDLVVW